MGSDQRIRFSLASSTHDSPRNHPCQESLSSVAEWFVWDSLSYLGWSYLGFAPGCQECTALGVSGDTSTSRGVSFAGKTYFASDKFFTWKHASFATCGLKKALVFKREYGSFRFKENTMYTCTICYPNILSNLWISNILYVSI